MQSFALDLLTGPLGWAPAAWLQLFLHFALLSLLAVGGAITTTPDMHRFVVGQKAWLTDTQFAGSIALAQAAPGPNVLFVAVIGFNVAGLAGLTATLGGSLLPSTLVAVTAGRFGEQRRDSRLVRSFTEGLAPLTIGLLLATGWVLTEPTRHMPAAILLVLLTVMVMLRTKASPLWLIAVGAVVGGLGWV